MEKLYSYDELEEIFGVKRQTIKNWVKEGRLKACKITSHTIRFKESDLLQLFQSGSGIDFKG